MSHGADKLGVRYAPTAMDEVAANDSPYGE